MPQPTQTALERRWADAHERKLWYEGGAAYWNQIEPVNDGVLGGYGRVHGADVRDSLQFVRSHSLIRDRGGATPTAALDVAAGIGRVTGGTLLEVCDQVDLMEGSEMLLNKAREALQWAGPRIGQFACARMQDFTPDPGRYDLIWIQWCIGSLTDADLEAFLKRCAAGLAPGGTIVIKDNVLDLMQVADDDRSNLHASTWLVDQDDNSVMRTKKHLEELLTGRCRLKLVAHAVARLDCDELHPVHSYALRPQ